MQLLWNIFLLILGRHPIQNPAHIRPEISKLPRHLVDKLPLVIYIPHPPDHHGANGVSIPEAAYSYPPKPKRQKPRFAWLNKLRASRKGYSADGKSGFETKISDNKRKGIGHDWEDNFEQGEFPFVRLEGNRATCAICLMDFEEPTRVVKDSKPVLDQMDPSRCDTTLSPVGEGVEEYDDLSHHSFAVDDLKLEDAGEGAQPLRLLFCGHVFHVSLQRSMLYSPFRAVTENLRGSLVARYIGTLSRLSETCRISSTQETAPSSTGFFLKLIAFDVGCPPPAFLAFLPASLKISHCST